mmetsp:Transcript_31935/g.42284  ORF Transcript_31935/g.42284 Transcript_31935/m.42284 type:complete len:172 (+) Transcript_31935:114-629(+)
MPPKSTIAAKRTEKANSKKGKKKGSDDEAYVASTGGKAAKAEKDPDAPKKPQTSYFLFMNAKRPETKAADPSLTFGTLTKKLTEMWKGLSDEDRKEWEDKAREDKERYQAEMEAKGLATKVKKVDEGQPKKALSAFMLYSATAREKLKDENLKQTEILKRIGQLWKELGAD